jgi:hypothetical protein
MSQDMTPTAPATQTRHPWQAIVRTVLAAAIGLLPVLPEITNQLGLSAIPWVISLLAVTGGITSPACWRYPRSRPSCTTASAAHSRPNRRRSSPSCKR